jgi:hypothetical protein
VTEESIKGFKGYQWTLLDFENHWAVVTDASPILKVFAQNVPSLENLEKMIDFSWYDEKKDTYELADKADLYGFAMLSSETDYKGKTIKLTKDIVVNTGDASKWATKAPEYAWTAVGTRTLPFAGTFDGNMHRIEGIYVNTNEKYSGLFGVVGSNATVKNLKLTNSYFQTSTSDFGSVTGRLDGTLDNIYTDAIVVGRIERVGGFVGIASGSKATIKNCWFAGSVKNTANHNVPCPRWSSTSQSRFHPQGSRSRRCRDPARAQCRGPAQRRGRAQHRERGPFPDRCFGTGYRTRTRQEEYRLPQRARHEAPSRFLSTPHGAPR